jgi:Transcriptional Coactivator p15 (PC4)
VRTFKGKTLIDIREYYQSGAEMKPGKKGIAINADQWRTLAAMADEVTAAVEELESTL